MPSSHPPFDRASTPGHWPSRPIVLWWSSMSAPSILPKIVAELLRLESLAAPRPPAPPEQPVHAKIQDSLSGAFGCKVSVKERAGGGVFALIPVGVFQASGLTVQRSVVTGTPPVLVGEDSAVFNAERRVSKRLGEGWKAQLVEYEPHYAIAIFNLDAPRT